jgi:hypothetical protein
LRHHIFIMYPLDIKHKELSEEALSKGELWQLFKVFTIVAAPIPVSSFTKLLR